MKKSSWLAVPALGLLMAACSGVSSLGDGGQDGGMAGTGNGQSGSGNGSGGGTGNEPCANKPCGATCSTCDPSSMGCTADPVAKYCDQQGGCGLAYPVCDAPGECVNDADCSMQVSLAPCEICPDGTYACPQVYCDQGQCVGSFPGCQGGGCEMDADCPQAGAPCQMCPDGTTSCPSSQCINGMCAGSFPGCGTYDPCAGLACGDYCSPCPPDDPMCASIAVVMYCNADGSCDTTPPECGPSEGCMTQNDCPQSEACVLCGNNTCAEIDCLQNKCVFTCPPVEEPQCQSAMDCVFDASCQICADGTCAQGGCIDGKCQRVCGM